MLQTQRSRSAEGLPRITQACTNSVTTVHLLETLTEEFSHWQCWRKSSPIGNTSREVLLLATLTEKFSYTEHRQRSSPIDNAGGEVLLLATLTEKFSYSEHWQRSSPIDNAGGEVLLLALQPNEVHGNVRINVNVTKTNYTHRPMYSYSLITT